MEAEKASFFPIRSGNTNQNSTLWHRHTLIGVPHTCVFQPKICVRLCLSCCSVELSLSEECTREINFTHPIMVFKQSKLISCCKFGRRQFSSFITLVRDQRSGSDITLIMLIGKLSKKEAWESQATKMDQLNVQINWPIRVGHTRPTKKIGFWLVDVGLLLLCLAFLQWNGR